jgi:hypothetical protein
MRFDQLARAFGQALGEALAENGKFKFEREDDEDWQTLEQICLTVAEPTVLKVALGRNDVVRVKEGEKLAVAVEGGEETESELRFIVTEDTIKMARRRDARADKLEIEVTMPAPHRISVGGAGRVEAATVAAEATVASGGAGPIAIEDVSGSSLAAKIGGSGKIVAKGSVTELALKIGGSGHFLSPDLQVERARIAIGGSGKAELACEGEVEAKIGGSGDILVRGTPRVSLRSGGAGRLRCEPVAEPVD